MGNFLVSNRQPGDKIFNSIHASNIKSHLLITFTISLDPKYGPGRYFRGDWLWNNLYGHPAPFRWIIQERLLSVTSESMCTKYWLTACSSLPRKKVFLYIGELTVPPWPLLLTWDVKQQNKWTISPCGVQFGLKKYYRSTIFWWQIFLWNFKTVT